MLPSITVKIVYEGMLELVTGVKTEPAVVSQGITFTQMLFFIFKSYPEIEERYGPGELALSVNGFPPDGFTQMQDGDVVVLTPAKGMMSGWLGLN